MSEQGSRTWLETPALEGSSTWWWKSTDDQRAVVDIDLIIGAATHYIVVEREWGTQRDVLDALEDYIKSLRAEAWEDGWDAGAGGSQRGNNPYKEGADKEVSPTRQRYLDHLAGPTKGSN